ncbi:hypothetical protein EDD34_0424 [Myceligenerans xiligouense]|uniref:Sulfotransferase family protein n=1 Tax=Myceligenerans xiligouense TaxID=253184 RepID=A0A3N4Z1C3_9MICO|nr:hypothetical protein EDD34_0424 [Myceligenerans xiligouense]
MRILAPGARSCLRMQGSLRRVRLEPMSSNSYRREAVFVVSSGRSGASTIAGILRRLGCHTPTPEVNRTSRVPEDSANRGGWSICMSSTPTASAGGPTACSTRSSRPAERPRPSSGTTSSFELERLGRPGPRHARDQACATVRRRGGGRHRRVREPGPAARLGRLGRSLAPALPARRHRAHLAPSVRPGHAGGGHARHLSGADALRADFARAYEQFDGASAYRRVRRLIPRRALGLIPPQLRSSAATSAALLVT